VTRHVISEVTGSLTGSTRLDVVIHTPLSTLNKSNCRLSQVYFFPLFSSFCICFYQFFSLRSVRRFVLSINLIFYKYLWDIGYYLKPSTYLVSNNIKWPLWQRTHDDDDDDDNTGI